MLASNLLHEETPSRQTTWFSFYRKLALSFSVHSANQADGKRTHLMRWDKMPLVAKSLWALQLQKMRNHYYHFPNSLNPDIWFHYRLISSHFAILLKLEIQQPQCLLHRQIAKTQLKRSWTLTSQYNAFQKVHNKLLLESFRLVLKVFFRRFDVVFQHERAARFDGEYTSNGF